MEEDWTDRMLGRWSSLNPELDVDASQAAERLGRIALHFGRWQDDVFAKLGLNRGEVGVLYALRGADSPQRLSPTQLSRALMLTSAGITGRLDRLERQGLIARLQDPNDRRGIVIELTREGAKLANEAMASGAQATERMMSGLSRGELHTLARLLRKLQAALEPSAAARVG